MTTKQQTKNHLFPPRQIYFNDEDKSYHLELDGFNCYLQLTKTGADVIKLACANTPVHRTWGEFWGYKNYPKVNPLLFHTKLNQAPYKLLLLSYFPYNNILVGRARVELAQS